MEVLDRSSPLFEADDDVSDERKAALIGQILRGELTPQEACESERLSEAELKRWVHAYTRAARRAIDNQVSAALAAHGFEVDDPPTPELSGNLGSVGLAELIQTIHLGRKDAHIRIDHDGMQSELWCEQGDIIDAASAQLTGSAAVYRILAIERGQLHADFVAVDRPRTIHASTQALMLEAAKRADECAEIRSRLGDTLNLYVPSSSAPSELEIEPDQAAVLRAFDGERSIEDVVHQSELPDLETLLSIERLIDQEWLVLKPFHSIRRASRVPPPVVTPSLVEASFRPLAASLAGRLSWHDAKQRLWASGVAGVAVVISAFAIGFYSARSEAPPSSAASASVLTCGANQAPLPGGMCIDRAEVSAGDYQACVRSGACEPAQRELEPPPASPLRAEAAAQPGGAAPAAAPEAARAESATSGAALSGQAASGAASGAAASGAAAPEGVPSEGTSSPATLPASVQTPPAAAPPSPSAVAAQLPSRSEPSARCNAGLPGREHHSINCVTFQQARRYCAWRGGRLPSSDEWVRAAAPERRSLGVTGLAGGLSEWAIEPATGATETTRERAVVLGGGLETGSGTAGALTRLYMNANAQGRNVGFRCVTSALPDGSAAGRAHPASR